MILCQQFVVLFSLFKTHHLNRTESSILIERLTPLMLSCTSHKTSNFQFASPKLIFTLKLLKCYVRVVLCGIVTVVTSVILNRMEPLRVSQYIRELLNFTKISQFKNIPTTPLVDVVYYDCKLLDYIDSFRGDDQ